MTAAVLGDAFRNLLTGPIVFTPFVENRHRGIRFEGRIGLAALLGSIVVGEMVIRAGIEPATL